MKTVIVHTEKCVGCKHCTLACAIEHSQTKALFSAVREDPVPAPRIHVDIAFDLAAFPNRCRHCSPAPCLEACPAGAIARDQQTESVLIDGALCINCAMCAMACPFGVISEKPDGKRVLKCDLCIERLAQHKLPACVAACPTAALEFADSEESNREKRQKTAEQMVAAQASATETTGGQQA